MITLVELFYFLTVTCICLGNHESKTFFSFGPHPMVGGKLDVGSPKADFGGPRIAQFRPWLANEYILESVF